MTEARYKTLAELKAAIASGELCLDPNDGDCLLVNDERVALYKWNRDVERHDGYGMDTVFYARPSEVLRQALDLLGLPWEEP